jgi:hypothetical protein
VVDSWQEATAEALGLAREVIEISQDRASLAEAAIRRVRRLHFAYRGPSDWDSCAHCNRVAGGVEVPWPCDTIRALDGTDEQPEADQ